MKENWSKLATGIIIIFVFFLSNSINLLAEDVNQADSLTYEQLIVFNAVNKARANPWQEASRLGFDIELLRQKLDPSLSTMFDNSLPPLRFSKELSDAANSHLEDMLARGYFSHISPEGVYPESRVLAFGYYPLWVNEVLGAMSFSNFIPVNDGLKIITDSLIFDGLNGTSEGRKLFDPYVKDIGIGVKMGQINVNGHMLNVLILCIETSINALSIGPCIYGRVYKDLDNNGRFTPGEGISGKYVHISVYFAKTFFPTDGSYTAGDGNYLIALYPNNLYLLSLEGRYMQVMLYQYPVRADFKLN